MLKREVRDAEMEGLFFKLPSELIMRILSLLDFKQLVSISLVSWRWKIFSQDDNLVRYGKIA